MEQDSQLAEPGLFDAIVPRYTSYPAAPHFGNSVDSNRFSGWISSTSPGAKISAYVHVPYCRRLCWFCACRTQGTRSGAPVQAYIETLKAEIALLRARLPEGVTLSRLHWGGGTPTLLTPALIADLAGAIDGAVPFAPDAGFSVEVDPNEIDAARLDSLCAAGLTRAVIGVQDFDGEIQRSIGRIQSFEITRRAVEMIRSRGIRGLNADFLYGLPHQTVPRITESTEKLLALNPDRVALYGYAHVPRIARRQTMIPPQALPPPEARLELFGAARRLFLRDGYREIGCGHFARPEDSLAAAQQQGRLRRNFQGYTDDTTEALIGIGASAVSRFPQGYAQNAAGTSEHAKAVQAGRFATARGHVFRGDDRLRARMIEALMCDFRISAVEITSRFAISAEALQQMFGAAARAFPGMLVVTDAGLAVAEHARPLTRMIARSFDAYEPGTAGRSPAV